MKSPSAELPVRPEASAATPDAEVFRPLRIDWPTLGLLALMWAGLLGNLIAALAGPPFAADAGSALRGLLHVVVGVAFLNLSFTIWHEAAHGTVFSKAVRGHRGLNAAVGVLGAWPAMLPYFMLARVHRLHHAHTNDPERDPDVWFLEGSAWGLPLRYPRGMARAARLYAQLDPPAWEQRFDRAALALVVLAIVACAWRGEFGALLFAWIVPKALAMWIHAWYVNIAPHRGRPVGRYVDTRIFPSAWLTPLCVFHNYHGLHHAWQSVPWHRYGRAYRARAEFLAQRGTPLGRDARRAHAAG